MAPLRSAAAPVAASLAHRAGRSEGDGIVGRTASVGGGSSGGTERDCTAVPASVGDDFGTGDEFWSWVTGYLSSLVSRTRHRAPAPRHRRLEFVAGGGDVAGSCD